MFKSGLLGLASIVPSYYKKHDFVSLLMHSGWKCLVKYAFGNVFW